MFSEPLKNLKIFELKENDIVADLGAGTGFYSLAAGVIASRGKVYAVELQKDFLDTIKNKIKEAHLNNIEIIWGNVEKIGGTKIGDGVVSAVIASNILFQVEDKGNFILEIKRILKPKGRVLLIDWSESSVVNGANIISKEKALLMFEKEGFSKEREIKVGDYHYGMIFVKQ
jgi:ubiquinone/menaquinone biosynthesis C-methylase UbiE